MRLWSLLLLVPLCLPGRGGTGDSSLKTLEGLVKIWTELRQEIAAEKREWRGLQTSLQSEIALLEAEIETLELELKEFEDFSSAAQRENQDRISRSRELRGYLNDLEPLLNRMEAFLRSRRDSLPESLREQVPLPEKSRVVDRVQAVATGLIALEELQSGLHRTREILEDADGVRREMEVLYLGLARAYAVSTSNDWAGTGTPAGGGWAWTSRPELAGKIRKLFEIMSEQRPGELVELPVGIAEVSP